MDDPAREVGLMTMEGAIVKQKRGFAGGYNNTFHVRVGAVRVVYFLDSVPYLDASAPDSLFVLAACVDNVHFAKN